MRLMAKQARKRGRPPAGDRPMTQLAVRFTDDQLVRIDHVIEDRRGQADRASIIREMVERGLESVEKGRRKGY